MYFYNKGKPLISTDDVYEYTLGGFYMNKTFVLDTNVLLQSPNSLLAFGDNKVVLTEAVLEELDKFKKDNSELGANARAVARFLDKLREQGRLIDGVTMENGGILKVESNHYDVQIPASWDKAKADNRILQVCKALQDAGENVQLITKDILERIKADIMDVVASDFENEQAPTLENQYKGRKDIYLMPDVLQKFKDDDGLALNDLNILNELGKPFKEKLFPNEFLIIHSIVNPKQTLLGIVDSSMKAIRPLFYDSMYPYGVTPKNVGQKFMQEALMASVSDIPLVIIKGPAGTAKTFYSLACGLQKVVEEREYRKILVCRPTTTMDEDLGFLPGTETEKIAPYMRPIKDNLEVLVDSNASKRYENEKELSEKVQFLFEKEYITTEAVGFLRGRSIVKQWIIIDEAQNLTPKQAKAIITRAGEGTKIIMVGDPEQIDNPFMDARTNGLSYAAEKMKGSKYCAQITLDGEECVRSKLAQDGASRMK